MSNLAETWARLEQAFVKPTREALRKRGWSLITHERHCWQAERQAPGRNEVVTAMTPARLLELIEGRENDEADAWLDEDFDGADDGDEGEA